MRDIFIKKRREIILNTYKVLLRHYGKSLVFSVTDSGIVTASVTDITENKGFCGVHTGNVSMLRSFLDRQIQKIRNDRG